MPSLTPHSPQSLRERLCAIRHVVLDMDGTIYVGGRLLECTRPFLSAMRERGVGCTFLTNNNSLSRSQYLDKLRGLGIEATADDLFTSTDATADHLRKSLPDVRRLFVLGTAGLRHDLAEAGFEVERDEPQAVVVGFDTGLTYERLCTAAYWLSRGLPFIATHPDRVCPTDLPTVLPDCGAMCALLTHATGRTPDAVCGKPEAQMLRSVLERHGLKPEHAAMVGDRLYTDMEMSRRVGTLGVLVLSGEATAEQAAASDLPDMVVADLAEFQTRVSQSHAE